MFNKPQDLDQTTLDRKFHTTVKSQQYDQALFYAQEVIARLEKRLANLENENTELVKRFEKIEKSGNKQSGSKSSQKDDTVKSEAE